MNIDLNLLSSAIVLIAGFLMGATRVVPTLVSVDQISVIKAVSSSSAAMTVPSAYFLWAHLRSHLGEKSAMQRLPSASTPWVMISCMVIGAFTGAAMLPAIQTTFILLAVGLLCVLSAWFGWHNKSQGEATALAPWLVQNSGLGAAFGFAVGLGSSLTGTGGPVLFMPILLLLQQPLRLAAGMAQIIQLPIALAASLTALLKGHLHLPLALSLGVILLVGSILGRRAAQQLPVQVLSWLIAIVLACTGVWISARVLLT